MCIINKVCAQLILQMNIDGESKKNIGFQLVILLENPFH